MLRICDCVLLQYTQKHGLSPVDFKDYYSFLKFFLLIVQMILLIVLMIMSLSPGNEHLIKKMHPEMMGKFC